MPLVAFSRGRGSAAGNRFTGWDELRSGSGFGKRVFRGVERDSRGKGAFGEKMDGLGFVAGSNSHSWGNLLLLMEFEV